MLAFLPELILTDSGGYAHIVNALEAHISTSTVVCIITSLDMQLVVEVCLHQHKCLLHWHKSKLPWHRDRSAHYLMCPPLNCSVCLFIAEVCPFSYVSSTKCARKVLFLKIKNRKKAVIFSVISSRCGSGNGKLCQWKCLLIRNLNVMLIDNFTNYKYMWKRRF